MNDSKQIKWVDVPDGALVRVMRNGGITFALKQAGRGFWTGPATWEAPIRSWIWWSWDSVRSPATVTIVALGLTGQETAADLRRLAEVFEVREAVARDFSVWRVVQTAAGGDDERSARDADVAATIDRLHAAGWRPGMTAEDAARLLSEART